MSYLGGSTLIKTRTKGWWRAKNRQKKRNNEIENHRLNVNKEIYDTFEPETILIKKSEPKGE